MANSDKSGNVATWSAKVAKNDKDYGRDSKYNPNNQSNGK